MRARSRGYVRWILLVVIAAAVAWYVWPRAVRPRAVVGKAAPSFADVRWIPYFKIGDEPSDFESPALKGKLVLVDFFATWCVPCKQMAPHLRLLAKKYREQGLAVLAVSEERYETLAEFRKNLEWDFPVGVDDNAAARLAYGVTGFPTTVLVDREGRVAWRGVGVPAEQIEAEIVARLGPPPAVPAGG